MSMKDNDYVEAAASLANRPTTWSDLYITFETIKRNLGGRGKKGSNKGYQMLLENNWLTEQEAKSFSDTANFFRHGLPRDPIGGVPMSLEDADTLIRRLFSQLVKLKYSE